VYVDDVGGSCSIVQEAKRVITGIDIILESGKFEIKTWHSNKKEIDQTQNERFTDLLGHKWDKELDKFTFKKEEVLCKLEAFTKEKLPCYSCPAVGSNRAHLHCHHKVPNRPAGSLEFRLWVG
jgi:hypothetical protein